MKSFLAGSTLCLLVVQVALSNVYNVSTTGSDVTGDGTLAKPWKSLQFAVTRVPADQGHTIQLAQGTYTENGLIAVPTGVNITGAGIDLTILQAASSFFYNPATPGYATNKFLISLNNSTQVNGNQTLSAFTIDGGVKQLHGGIFVQHRNNVTIDQVKVKNTNFTGIWLWDVKDSKIRNSTIINSSWGSVSYCSGALNLGNLERVEIDGLTVDESTGYGIKAIGPSPNNNIWYVNIHNSHISVAPSGLWSGGSAPNMAIELWQVNLVGNEIHDTYVDNTISLVNSNALPSTGIQTIRVHHNIIDCETRANGAGYGVELTMHDVEIDHNYFLKGTYGIANWYHPMTNWSIHHNSFYALQGTYPGEILRVQSSGLHNVKMYNNTVEFAGTKTMNFLGLYGGSSDNVDIENNLVINNNTSYSYYTNQLIHLENGAVLTGLNVKNNSIYKMPVGTVSGTYLNNITTDPRIMVTGNRPDPYYTPTTGSPLIDAGLNVGLPFTGSAPDIGAFESVTTANILPSVTITSPLNNASVPSGTTVTINATASDTDGTIAKVEFFQGSTLLGQDLTSPYSFAWANVPAGSYSLTARATDNLGGIKVSTAAALSVTGNTLPTVLLTSPVNNASFASGSTIPLAATAADADGSVAMVEFLNGAAILGQDLTSPYTFSWANVPAGNYSITARATDNLGGIKVSTAVALSVTSANTLPTVSLTTPVNNASFVSGSPISIAATAADADGSVAMVEFLNGTTILGQDLISPYTFSWANVPVGNYSITARATDNLGGIKVSTAVALSVTSANTLPTVSLTAPVNNASFVSGSTISLAATAADADGSIAKVEFLNGTAILGQDLTSPYTFSWANVPVGNYSITARATDNLNATKVSTSVAITVTANNIPPVVTFMSPANNAVFSAGTSLTIAVNASDSDGQVAKVEFYNGTTLLGQRLASPWSLNWTPPSAGSYPLTTKVIDNGGAIASSAISISVVVPATIQLGFDSSDAILSGGMVAGYDASAAMGSYFSMPTGSGRNYAIPSPAKATFNFNLSAAGNFVVWVKTKSLTTQNQGHYIYDGKGHWSVWSSGVHSTWTWSKITNNSTAVLFSLNQGVNALSMYWYDENAQVDQIIITNDLAYTPEQDPAPPSQFIVFPNPVISSTLTVRYTSTVAQQARVSIFNNASTLVFQSMVNLVNGVNDVIVDVTYIYSGPHILQFQPMAASPLSTPILIDH